MPETNYPGTIISGVGEVAPERKSGRSAEALVLDAIARSLEDAKLRPCDVDGIVTESNLCPQMTPIDRIAVSAGIHNLKRTAQTSPVGAGILASVGVACEMVASGTANHVLTYFGVDWGTNSSGPTEYHSKMSAKKVVEEPAGFAGPPLYFAAIARRYQHVHGLTDGQLAEMLQTISIAARSNATRHPAAQMRLPLDPETYAASKMVAEPLRGVDCSLLSDGAVALVISRADTERRGRSGEAYLKGWSYAVDPIADMDFYTQSPWLPHLPAASRAADAALTAAGMAVGEIDLFQLYDCFSIALPLQFEAIGRIPQGRSFDIIRDGVLAPDGEIPTNTHGGLLAHGYLLGAGHVAEAVHQLRGTAGERQVADARSAFVGAGPGRQYTALVLGRQESPR